MNIMSDDYATQDLIGHAVYRDGLIEMIGTVKSKGSFTIGVFGDWGTGKTSILKQIQSSLDEADIQNDQPVITIWFNPWQFVSDEHLIIPFFHTFISSLERASEKSLLEKWKPQIFKLLSKIAHVPISIVYGMEAKFGVPFLLESKFTASKTIEYQKKVEEEIEKRYKEIQETDIDAAAKKYESTYYNLIGLLQDVVSELNARFVVFIDDLDRCLPDRAVQLLEGLKVLLDIPNFIFVVGVSREVIERGIRIRYKELFDTSSRNVLSNLEVEYIDKIIQFPFSLPSAESNQLKNNILKPQLVNLDNSDTYVDLVYSILGGNPRTIKRFLNTIAFARHISDKGKNLETDFLPELIIKITLLGYLFPVLYRQFETYPDHLVRIENIINGERLITENKKNEPDDHSSITIKSSQRKTGLPIIDQWLNDAHFFKLSKILEIRRLGTKTDSREQVGFRNTETVVKYLRLSSTSLKSEISIQDSKASLDEVTMIQQLVDRMNSIEPSPFIMGDEKSGQIEITDLRPFMIDKYPVTQRLYRDVMKKNPSYFKGDDLPVENVTWIDAITFCNELSTQLNMERVYDIAGDSVSMDCSRVGYRLPNESEWEFACRGYTEEQLMHHQKDIAWSHRNSEAHTHRVGQMLPNKYGLFDMLGNVWEWCNDWYQLKYPKTYHGTYLGPISGSTKVLRGGSWASFENDLKETIRNKEYPAISSMNIGFRIALSINSQ